MRIPIWMVALGVAGIAASGVGCSGGGGGGDDDDDGGSGLQTGSYTVSGAAYAGTDECDLPNTWGIDVASYNGATVEITAVTATQVTFAGQNGPNNIPRAGNVIGGDAELVFEADWSDTAASGLNASYNCMEEDYLTVTYTIVNDTTLDYEEFWTLTSTAGSAADCIVANASAYAATITTWPCESTITADITHN